MFFYLFVSSCLLYFSLNIIFSKNTVYSILSLILVFVFSSLLLLFLGLDYMPLIFITIYIGALSVLFIFVIMMLQVKTYGTKNNTIFYLLFAILLFSFLYLDSQQYYLNLYFLNELEFSLSNFIEKMPTIKALGSVLFTNYFIYICLASLSLLIAMIGSVVLVLEPYKKLKNQRIYQQISRNFNNSYFKVK